MLAQPRHSLYMRRACGVIAFRWSGSTKGGIVAPTEVQRRRALRYVEGALAMCKTIGRPRPEPQSLPGHPSLVQLVLQNVPEAILQRISRTPR